MTRQRPGYGPRRDRRRAHGGLERSDVQRRGLFSDCGRRWFAAGRAGSGLIATMAAMRLMHVRFDAHAVGEATSPSIGAGDGLVMISGSGRDPGHAPPRQAGAGLRRPRARRHDSRRQHPRRPRARRHRDTDHPHPAVRRLAARAVDVAAARRRGPRPHRRNRQPHAVMQARYATSNKRFVTASWSTTSRSASCCRCPCGAARRFRCAG
jgi:hypothetical protein